MKNTLLFLVFLMGLFTTSHSQKTGNITIFSDSGEKFYVELNGVKQNQIADVNVKITGLESKWYKCRIIAETNVFEVNKNLTVKFDTLMTYRLFERKGKHKVRFFSENSLGTETFIEDQQSIEFTPIERPLEEVVINTNVGVVNETTTTTTTTTVSGTSTGTVAEPNTSDSFSMNVNVGGVNANVNINANESSETTISNTGQIATYEETTTTTTTISSGSNVNYIEETEIVEEVIECFSTDADAVRLKSQIKNESFSDDKMRIAKLALKNNCFSVDQIGEISSVFTFQDDCLSFLKAAYDSCTDSFNYYQLMEVLTYSSDKEELEAFINSK